MQHLQKARVVIAKHSQQLADYIGPEVPLLIELCMKANGASVEQYRMANDTKVLCSSVATALRARTDNEEYIVPVSPRNTAKRAELKASVPFITGYSGAIGQTGNDSRMTAPSPRTSNNAPSQTLDADAGLPTSPVTSRSLPRSLTDVASAAMVVELKGQQRQQLAHSVTVTESTSPRQDTNDSPYRPQPRQQTSETGDQAALKKKKDHVRNVSNIATDLDEPVKKSREEKRKLHRSMHYTTPPIFDFPDASNVIRTEDKTALGSVKGEEREHKKRRAAQKELRLSQPSVKEMEVLKKSSLSRKQEKASTELEMTGPAALPPQYNNALMKKWAALDQKLGTQFDPKARDAVSRLLTFCHGLDPNQVDKPALMDIVTAAEMSRRDRDALIQARNVLLADSLRGTQAVAATLFPELLSLLVFAIDAQRALRAKS
jgi:hypothetical protein